MAESFEVITLSSSDEDPAPEVSLSNKRKNENLKTQTSKSFQCSNSISSSSFNSTSATRSKGEVRNTKVSDSKTAREYVSANSKLQGQNLISAGSILKRNNLNENLVSPPSQSFNESYVKFLTESQNPPLKSRNRNTVCKESVPTSHSNFTQKKNSLSSTEMRAKGARDLSVVIDKLLLSKDLDASLRTSSSTTSNAVQNSVKQINERSVHCNMSKTLSNPVSVKNTSSVHHQRNFSKPQVGSSQVSVSNQEKVTSNLLLSKDLDASLRTSSSTTSNAGQKSVKQINERSVRCNMSKTSSNPVSVKNTSSVHQERNFSKQQAGSSQVSVSNQQKVTSKLSENSKSNETESCKTLQHPWLNTLKKGGISVVNIGKNKESNACGSRKNDTEVIQFKTGTLESKNRSHELIDSSINKNASSSTCLSSNNVQTKPCSVKVTKPNKNLLESRFSDHGVNSNSFSTLTMLGEVEIIKKDPLKPQSLKRKMALKHADTTKSTNHAVKTVIPLPFKKLKLSTETSDSTKSNKKDVKTVIPLPFKKLELSTKTSNSTKSNENDCKSKDQSLRKNISSNLSRVKSTENRTEISSGKKSSYLVNDSSVPSSKQLNSGVNKNIILKPKSDISNVSDAESVLKSTKCSIDSNSMDIEMLEPSNTKDEINIPGKFSSKPKVQPVRDFSFKLEDSSNNVISLSDNEMDAVYPESEKPLPSIILNKPSEKSSDIAENLVNKSSGMMKKDFKSPQRSPVQMVGNEKPLRQVTSPKLSLKRKRNGSDVNLVEEKGNVKEDIIDAAFETASKSNDSSDVSLKENVPFHVKKKQKTDRLSYNEKAFHELLEFCKIVMKETEEEKAKVMKKICHRFESTQAEFLSSYELSALLKTTKKNIEKNPESLFIPLNSLVQELKAHKRKKSLESKVNPIEIEDVSRESISTKDSISSNPATKDNRTKSSKERLEKHAERLEKLLEKYDKEIKKLQSREMSLDNLDEDDSTYLLEDRYKRKFMKIWAELCRVKKRSVLAGRQIERRFTYQGTRFTPINLEIERKINKQKCTEKFPNYIEILQIVKDVNDREHLGLNEGYVIDLAKSVFRDVGTELKKRRQYDDDELLNGYLPVNYNPNEDPAEQDAALKTKLEESAELGSKRIAQVIDEYAEKQHLLPEDGQENMDVDENDEPDDDSEEDDDNLDDAEHFIENDDIQKEDKYPEETKNNSSLKKESSAGVENDDFMKHKKTDAEEKKDSCVAKKENISLKTNVDKGVKEIIESDELPITDCDSKSSEDIIIVSRVSGMKKAETDGSCPPTPDFSLHEAENSLEKNSEPGEDIILPKVPEMENEDNQSSCPPTPKIPVHEAESALENSKDQNLVLIDGTDYICEDVISIGSDEDDSSELPSLSDLLKKSS